MFCAHCGKKIEDDAAKCPHCGKENKAAQAKQAAAPQAKGQDAPQGAAPVKPAAGGKTAFQKFMGNKLLVGCLLYTSLPDGKTLRAFRKNMGRAAPFFARNIAEVGYKPLKWPLPGYGKAPDGKPGLFAKWQATGR